MVGEDVEEGGGEGVVDGALEAGGFAAARGGAAEGPGVVLAAEVDGGAGGGLEVLAIDGAGDGVKERGAVGGGEREGGGVGGGEGYGGGLGDGVVEGGLDAGVLPMFGEAGEVEPVEVGVVEGAGLEGEPEGVGEEGLEEGGLDVILEDLAGGGMVFVAHAGTDEVGEGGAVLLEGLGHDFGGGALGVFFAAVGEDGEVEEVAGVVGDVVLAPEGLFPEGGGGDLGGAEFLIALDVDEAGTGVEDGPVVGVVGPEEPGTGAAHGKAGKGAAVGIEAFFGDEEVAEVEDVGFGGAFESEAVAAPGVDDEGVGGVEFAAAAAVVGEEMEVGAGVAAALEPEPGGGVLGGGVGGDFEGEGLGGAVEGAVVAADDEAGGAEPGGAVGGEVGEAAVGFGEEFAGFGGVCGLVEFLMFEGVADGLEEDFGVGVGGLGGEALEAEGELLEGGGEFGAVGFGDFGADGGEESGGRGGVRRGGGGEGGGGGGGGEAQGKAKRGKLSWGKLGGEGRERQGLAEGGRRGQGEGCCAV